jgi:hypothetical protein
MKDITKYMILEKAAVSNGSRRYVLPVTPITNISSEILLPRISIIIVVLGIIISIIR